MLVLLLYNDDDSFWSCLSMSLSTPAAAYLHRPNSSTEIRPLRILVANNGLSACKFIRSTAKAQLQPEM